MLARVTKWVVWSFVWPLAVAALLLVFLAAFLAGVGRWLVTLVADDPVTIKEIVYEMRFDEASVWYAEFGPFYTGLQFSPEELPRLFDGHVPALHPPAPAAPA